MEISLIQMILDFWAIFLMIGIVIAYGYACFWNLQFIRMTLPQTYTWIKKLGAIIYGFMAVVFIYLIIIALMGNPMDASLLALLSIRPLIFLTGCVAAASARARISSLKNGGEQWILRKSKI